MQSYDILVAKDYETQKNGISEKKTIWNKVGKAWNAQSSENLSLEFFHLPNQRYVLALKSRDQQQQSEQSDADMPFDEIKF